MGGGKPVRSILGLGICRPHFSPVKLLEMLQVTNETVHPFGTQTPLQPVVLRALRRKKKSDNWKTQWALPLLRLGLF